MRVFESAVPSSILVMHFAFASDPVRRFEDAGSVV